MNISLGKQSKEHGKVVFDIVRIFIPTITWQQLLEEEQEEGYLLDIEACKQGIAIKLSLKGQVHYSHTLSVKNGDSNEIKRAIKLAVYQGLEDILDGSGSPWGILTGIRPTKIVHRLWDQGYPGQEIAQILARDYQVSSKKVQALLDITKLQRAYLLSPQEVGRKVSIYISIPFCPSRCHYCSFPAFSIAQWSREVDNYVQALVEEIKQVGHRLKQQSIEVQTIYIGGGTPTSLSANQLAMIIDALNAYLPVERIVEFTVEAGRPDTITKEKLEVLKDGGVCRISINPQTMWQPTLKSIGRCHSPEDVLEKFELAKELSFKVINMDLILGLPRETKDQLAYTLEGLKELRPDNITFHTLAIKRGAQLQEQNLPGDTTIKEMEALKEEWCHYQGYLPYYLYRQKQIRGNLENIGYTLPGKPCIYNIQMMEERQTIWGLGVGACSKIVNDQDWTLESLYNPKDILIYQQRIQEIINTKVDKICNLG